MQDLITIDSAPAKLDANFEEVQKELEKHLEQYNTVVTADGVKDAKAAAPFRDIRQRCNDDKARQDMVHMRLLELENRSYRAGLSAPLTKDHVRQWLEADEATYEQQLQRILEAEIARQEQAEQKMRQQLQREQEQQQQAEEDRQRREAAAEKASAQREEDHSPAEPEQPEEQHKPSPEPASGPSREPGKHGVTITCQFHTELSPSVDDEAVKAELRRRMEVAGFTTLASITITRHETEGVTEDA